MDRTVYLATDQEEEAALRAARQPGWGPGFLWIRHGSMGGTDLQDASQNKSTEGRFTGQ